MTSFDPAGYRAAVMLSSAARLTRARGLVTRCTTIGLVGRCPNPGDADAATPSCICCTLVAARDAYAAAWPAISQAALTESLTRALETAEAGRLHTDPPTDPDAAAAHLRGSAHDLYRESLPASVLVVTVPPAPTGPRPGPGHTPQPRETR